MGGESELKGSGSRVFYSASCHPLLNRRRFLAGGAALVAAGTLGPPVTEASDAGAALIRRYASTPDDPWALCHGIRAMGREFVVAGGQRAVDLLLETQLAWLPANGKRVLTFPIQVEVHPNSFLKTMLEAGVPLDHAFTHQGSRRTLREVLDGGRALFRPSRVGRSANMLPWSVIAFSKATSPLRPRWTNAWGEPVDLDGVVEGSLRLLEQASLSLMQAMREGRPQMAKAPVHDLTCGGTHMLYAVLTAMHAGYTGQDRLQRTQQQVDLLVWRMRADIELIDRFYKARAGQPGRYWFHLDARLKLLGHAEECLAFGTRRGVVALTPAQEDERRTAVTEVKRMLAEMEKRPLSETRDLNMDLFRQLVGDACHARHGLTFT